MTKTIARYSIAIACLLHTVSIQVARCQSLANIAFETLGINDGLSQGMVNKIIQDRYGFMWFATKDGLNRYDGYHFKVYRHNPQDPNTISDGHVQTLLEDSKGRIWAGTASGNLELFNHATESFEHIVLEKDSAAAAAMGAVYQLAEDRQGNIWALCKNRVYLLPVHKNEDKKNGSWEVKKIGIPLQKPDNKLFLSKTGAIYFFNISDHVIYTWGGQQEWLLWKPAADYFSRSRTKEPLRITELLEDSISYRIYIVYSGGIVQIDQEHASPVLERTMVNYPHAFEDRQGNIWFMEEERLAVFNLASRRLTFVSSGNKQMQYHLTLIQSTCIDRSGMVWLGTGGYGLITLDPRTEQFHHLDKTSIFYFKERSDGRIMVNNGNGCFNTLDKNAAVYVDSIPYTRAKLVAGNFNDFSYPSFTDSLHRRWFADDKSLLCYDEKTGRSVSYTLPVTKISYNYGLAMAILSDGQDKVWIGGAEGLLCFNISAGKWKVYRNNPADRSSLSFNVVFTLCADPAQPKRFLWVGTNGGGLNRLDIQSGLFKRYTMAEGLPNNVVYGVLPDDDGRLWMSTNKGISCFDPVKETFRNFEEKDGLQSNEFNHDAYIKASDGTLFFGGVNGFNYFNPKEIVISKVVPKIAFTDFRIRNQPVFSGRSNAILHAPVYMTKHIELPYSDNMFSFEFAALDFIAPGRNQYKYMMVGFDKDWIFSGNINTATYTNLDPGNYTFIVKGSNKDEVWNEAGTSVELTILPPWYKTWWFNVLVALTIASVGYSFYKYRLNRALELAAVRNRIASDLHDEIGSNLSNISIFSNVAQDERSGAPQVQNMLEKISEYTQTSMEAMNDIVWMINSRNDRFENIMVRMRTLASEIFEAKDCNLHIAFDERLSELKLSMEKRKNFYLIFKEAVNNIAKYACCKDVWIEMRLKNKWVHLSVKDNGNGFDAAAMQHGNGLVNMKQRAALLQGGLQVISGVGAGTSIQLSFPVN